jgi:PAS domain S-box-containing protein
LKELLNVLLKNVPAGIAMLDRDMRYIVASDRWCEDYNVDCSKILGRSHYELFPDIPERWKETHRRALAGEVMRADADRWDRKDGTAWVCWQIHPWKKEDGTIGGILIFAENLTRSKQTEETLATISSKLVQIQEEERTRIARDLHDDVNQRLALLGLRVDEIKDNLPIEALEVRCQLGDIKQQIDELSTGVQSISRQLHSPQLEYLGLIPAMDAFCREFSERHKVRIRFIQEGVAKSMPHNISLCLFRILQEALHNAAKHSTVHQFDVRLRGHHQLIDLTVSDGGVGFDADGAINSGLGLLSMRERARMVNGTISIDSKPKGGTTIRVSVPLP